MHADRFDGLTRTIVSAGSRRGLLRSVAALPLVGSLLTLLVRQEAQGNGNGAIIGGGGGRRRRRKKHHHPGDDKDKRKGKGKKGKKGNKSVGCTPPCPVCQTCNAVGQCVANASQNRTNCGSGNVCCNGTCCDGCCTSDESCGACRVFATSTLQNGALGGLNGADGICQARALAGGLPGTYKAWLSTGSGPNESPATGRFRRSGRPYVLPVEVSTGLAHQVADNWTDLTDGTLDHAINVTELGGTVPAGLPSSSAWSNTAVDGSVTILDFDCSAWITTGGPPPFGGTGSATATDATWTQFGSSPCGVGAERRLYCFQQA